MKFDITVNDPLLEPFLPVIRRRHERSVLKELEFTNRKKRLADIFNNHLYFGLHRLPGKGWVFREWAPHATAIYLIGESNDWQRRENFSFHRLEGGVWELELPEEALWHGMDYKFWVEWPEGGGERIPGYVNRVVQDDLTKIFSDGKEDEYKAVDDVSFELFPGEKLAIIGESGSGKTTVVNMITRILDSTDGKILLDGEDITHYKRNKMKNIYRKMQMVFQTPTESFDPRCRLGDVVAESLRNAGMPKKEAMEIVKELFKQCGLPEDFMKRYPHEVSGGQCQRAAIARAIAIKPRLLILDEATSALDVTVQAEILQLLDALQEERQMSYLFICHDIALVQNFCDRVLVMYQGKIVEQGKTEEVLHFPKHEYTRMLLDSVL